MQRWIWLTCEVAKRSHMQKYSLIGDPYSFLALEQRRIMNIKQLCKYWKIRDGEEGGVEQSGWLPFLRMILVYLASVEEGQHLALT